ncbi:MAG: serine hydrolase [Alphaproteobacteria bacterium]|nr:serine hydrolase [Alphaproteobacteria bacterium]
MQITSKQTWLSLLMPAIAALTLSSALPARGAPQFSAGQQPEVRKTAFEFSMHQQLEGKVMGYSFVLMKDGKLISEGAGGAARNAADGFKAMTPRTPQNLGSLFKFISGVSLLHILERPPAGSAGGQNSFDARLNAPVALLYPQVWNAAMSSPRMRALTFRHLLQHKSGYRGCSGDDVLGCLSGAYNPRLIGSRAYENINFALAGYLIGIYTKPSLLTAANGAPATTSVRDRSLFFQKVAGATMNTFIRQKVFPKVPGNISASCDATNEYKANAAYTYISKNDTGKGIITSRFRDDVKACVGSGGYWMSVHDFAAFAATALHSEKLISVRTRRLMYNEQMDPDDRLVWSFSTSDSTIKSRFAMDPIIYSGGDQPYATGQGAHTAIVRLPLGHEVLVFANSDELPSSTLATIGIKAFKAGMTAN